MSDGRDGDDALRVLVVEDDPRTRRALHLGLREAGFRVASQPSGGEGLRLAATQRFDLVVLDWMLPDTPGIDVVRALRQRGHSGPVLLLTARDAIHDRVDGLAAGADDYVVKPFAFPELVARLHALARRARRATMDRQLALGPLVLDRQARRVSLGDVPIGLTPREIALLEALMAHGGEAVSRETLTREALHRCEAGVVTGNLLDVHVSRLRRKLEAAAVPIALRTVRGVGFRLEIDG